jgi:hypothetical protein
MEGNSWQATVPVRLRYESIAFVTLVNWCKTEILRDSLAPERCAEALCKRRLRPCRHEGRRRYGVGQRVTTSIDKVRHLPLLHGSAYMPHPSEEGSVA